MEASALSQGLRLFLDESIGELWVNCRTQTQLFDDSRQAEFVAEAFRADAVIITLHGGADSFAAYEQFEKAFANSGSKPYILILPSSSDPEGAVWAQKYSTEFGSPRYELASKYLLYGGRRNFLALLKLIYSLLKNQEFDPAQFTPPAVEPLDGIYHPDLPYNPSISEYFATKIDPQKPTVAIWFHQVYHLNGNLKHIDCLIRAIEKNGGNAYPVFHLRHKDKDLNNDGAALVAQKFFFTPTGKTRFQVLLSSMSFSMTLSNPETQNLYANLGVPVLQATICFSPREVWADSVQGIPSLDVSMTAAQPEFDGNLISFPFAFREQNQIDPLTKSLLVSYEPDPERTDKLARLAINWGKLALTPPEDRKIAIIFHNYPPRNDRIGCAAGLDSFRSVTNILEGLKNAGFRVDHTYPGEDELAHELLKRMTCDQRWLTPELMSARAEARADQSLFVPWYQELPPAPKEKTRADWGPVPGEIFTYQGEMLFPGLKNGNIFITIQPPRGVLEKIESIYHDLYLTPPHHYHSQYKWLRDVWGAQAFVHVGKHGSLEWLPGKAVGLSQECYPDIAILDIPNIYPYIINDPGEGTQAKRRGYACIVDHLTPALTNADLYDESQKIDSLVAELRIAEREDPKKVPILQGLIIENALSTNLDKDLNLSEVEMKKDFEGFLERLHSYLHELEDTMIGDGLHVLGKYPEGERLVDFLVQLTRIAGPGAPSLREALLSSRGFDYDELCDFRGKPLAKWGSQTGGEVIRENHALSLRLVEALIEEGTELRPELRKELSWETLAALTQRFLGKEDPKVTQALQYLANTLIPKVFQTTDELASTLGGLAGTFVKPGPSGAPSRGQCDILPTGRNFYSVDPYKIPYPHAWKLGIALGDALIERYLKETGKYPENVGILVYGTTTMRTRGDDVAEIFYLMGLRPVWLEGGYVVGLEVIPLEELGRPRLDVTPRISGFFRDSFPNLVDLLDTAVNMVAQLKEPPSQNYLRSHVYEDLEYYKQQGLPEAEAWREATFRVFGCPPGTYGAGVEELIESKKWQKKEDLAEIYIHFTGHAYGRDAYGVRKPTNFKRNLARMDVTIKNEDTREYDMMSCTDYYNYYGGLIAAAEMVRGKAPMSFVGDGADPKRIKIRLTAEEAKYVLRARLVNPKWLNGIKRHGYKGAGDLSKMMDTMFGWDATADVMDDWMYQKVCDTYALDPLMKEWMEKVNPFARQNILDKLLEAISRGMWDASDEYQQKLQNEYLELEGRLEEWNDRESIDERLVVSKS
jgi:cobaltochelatase CobN